MKPRIMVACAALVTLLACSTDTVDGLQWQRMQQRDRILYVKSLIGAEQVKDAKGGGGRTFAKPAEEYVSMIDAAYARGDARSVEEIFATLEPAR